MALTFFLLSFVYFSRTQKVFLKNKYEAHLEKAKIHTASRKKISESSSVMNWMLNLKQTLFPSPNVKRGQVAFTDISTVAREILDAPILFYSIEERWIASQNFEKNLSDRNHDSQQTNK